MAVTCTIVGARAPSPMMALGLRDMRESRSTPAGNQRERQAANS